MDAALVGQVWRRARACCEYCLMPQPFDDGPFEIDHVISRKHEGSTVLANLALSCYHCNVHKGPVIAGRDRATRRLVPLFNPRRHKWARHFRWRGPYLIGRTPIGRLTVLILNMNDPFRVELREGLIAEGLFPPN